MAADADAAPIGVQFYNPERHQNHVAWLPIPTPGVWSHAEVRVADTVGDMGRGPRQPGDQIQNVRISAKRTAGKAFYVDNIRLVGPGP